MFNFVKGQWVMGKLTEEQVDTLVMQGRLTQEQGVEIKSLPRAVQG